MKKLFFSLITASIVLVITFCSNEFDNIDYKINNNSSKDVSFLFNNISFTLNNGESISFTINSSEGIFAPKDAVPKDAVSENTAHPKSIKMDTLSLGTKGYIYSFIDNPKFPLDVINTLSVPLTIQADDYIDNNGQSTLTIKENDNETSFIYTSNPNFSLVSGSYPVTFDFNFTNNTVYLIIR